MHSGPNRLTRLKWLAGVLPSACRITRRLPHRLPPCGKGIELPSPMIVVQRGLRSRISSTASYRSSAFAPVWAPPAITSLPYMWLESVWAKNPKQAVKGRVYSAPLRLRETRRAWVRDGPIPLDVSARGTGSVALRSGQGPSHARRVVKDHETCEVLISEKVQLQFPLYHKYIRIKLKVLHEVNLTQHAAYSAPSGSAACAASSQLIIAQAGWLSAPLRLRNAKTQKRVDSNTLASPSPTTRPSQTPMPLRSQTKPKR